MPGVVNVEMRAQFSFRPVVLDFIAVNFEAGRLHMMPSSYHINMR